MGRQLGGGSVVKCGCIGGVMGLSADQWLIGQSMGDWLMGRSVCGLLMGRNVGELVMIQVRSYTEEWEGDSYEGLETESEIDCPPTGSRKQIAIRNGISWITAWMESGIGKSRHRFGR